MYVIYKATSQTTGKSYVGYTSNLKKRMYRHRWYAETDRSNTHFHRAIRKYGWDDFSWQVLEEVACEELAKERESYHITLGESYNMTEGGEGTSGFSKTPWNKGKTHSKETKRLLSEKAKGRKHSEETRRKMSEKRKGRKFSEEHRKNLSKSLKGIQRKSHDEETRKKIGEACSGSKHYGAISVTVNGKTYGTKKEAYTDLGISKYQLEKLLSADRS